jgi:hypothetical protein
LPQANADKEQKIFAGKIVLFVKGLGQMALEVSNRLSVEETILLRNLKNINGAENAKIRKTNK